MIHQQITCDFCDSEIVVENRPWISIEVVGDQLSIKHNKEPLVKKESPAFPRLDFCSEVCMTSSIPGICLPSNKYYWIKETDKLPIAGKIVLVRSPGWLSKAAVGYLDYDCKTWRIGNHNFNQKASIGVVSLEWMEIPQ